MSVLRLSVLLLCLLTGAARGEAQAPARLALIIDQTNYTGDLSRVALARSEADYIDKALKSTGFKITRKSDLTKSGLEDVLGEFRAALEASGPDTIAFVYYTGHGLQHPQSGDSYLLGIDARLKTASDLAVYGLDLASQRDGFAATGAQAIFLVFDACRNVPALPGFKGNKKGIGRVEAEPDMLIAYSTRLDDVAEEGVYAPILAEELARPGQTAETAFTAAQRRVQQTTARKQRPYTDMDLSNEVCFAGCTVPAGAAATHTILLPPAPLRKGDTFVDNLKDGNIGPTMVVIPAGEFTMGSSILEKDRGIDEGMVRTIRVPQDFAVSQFEITEDEYARCVASGACSAVASSSSVGASIRPMTTAAALPQPVRNVSWDQASAYAQYLSSQTGKAYRLLSEAEWEYAARAGTTGRFHNGGDEKDLCDIANIAFPSQSYCQDGFTSVAPIGSLTGNAFSLYDMHGNVSEWTLDCYSAAYNSARTDSAPQTSCTSKDRVVRGGNYTSPPAQARSASRDHLPPGAQIATVGFRLARDLN